MAPIKKHPTKGPVARPERRDFMNSDGEGKSIITNPSPRVATPTTKTSRGSSRRIPFGEVPYYLIIMVRTLK
jgi:hypothetical protein